MARLQLTPQTENVFTVFKDGWYPAEVAEHNASVEWQWTKKQAMLSFKNPKKDSVFYLVLDNPVTLLNEPQQVQVSLGGQAVDRFTLGPKQEVLRKIPLPAARLGSVDIAELEISVDKTFVPALLDSSSKDPRELGVRVDVLVEGHQTVIFGVDAGLDGLGSVGELLRIPLRFFGLAGSGCDQDG